MKAFSEGIAIDEKIFIIILLVILAGSIGISIPFIINSGDKLVSSSVRELEGET